LLRGAAFFDLDRTVIARSSALAFTRQFWRGGLMNRRSLLRSAYAQFLYMSGGADEDQVQRLREFMSTLVEGWDVATVRSVVDETLHSIVDPIVYEEAVALIAAHHEAGRDVVLVSASGEEVVGPIGGLLGADRVLASRLEIVDGRYTGRIESFNMGPAKADAMRALADAEGYDLARSYAYSDSSTDLPMLEVVGHPTAVNPDRTLRRTASERGWPIRVFSNPRALRAQSLRDRLTAPPVLAAAALGAGAITAGVIWRVSRR
jgi:HAD superfamily hydrolase (TIGR01490 family)